MKPPMRRSSVKLVLASSLPLALTACSPQEETYTVSQQVNYDSVEACVSDKVPEKACNDAYKQALAEYRRTTPTYVSKPACEAEFSPDGCQISTGGRYMPRMSGFALETTGEVTQAQVDAAHVQGGGYGHVATAVVAGMLWGRWPTAPTAVTARSRCMRIERVPGSAMACLGSATARQGAFSAATKTSRAAAAVPPAAAVAMAPQAAARRARRCLRPSRGVGLAARRRLEAAGAASPVASSGGDHAQGRTRRAPRLAQDSPARRLCLPHPRRRALLG